MATYRERIIEFMRDGRMVRVGDLVQAIGCPYATVSRLIGDHTVSAVAGCGLVLSGGDTPFPDERLTKIAMKMSKHAVLAGIGAAEFHDLADRNSGGEWPVFIPVNAYAKSPDNMALIRTSDTGKLTVGVEPHEVFPGAVVNVTSPARTICDLRFTEDAAVLLSRFVEAHGDVDGALRELSEMAEKLGCLGEMRFAIETYRGGAGWTPKL